MEANNIDVVVSCFYVFVIFGAVMIMFEVFNNKKK